MRTTLGWRFAGKCASSDWSCVTSYCSGYSYISVECPSSVDVSVYCLNALPPINQKPGRSEELEEILRKLEDPRVARALAEANQP